MSISRAAARREQASLWSACSMLLIVTVATLNQKVFAESHLVQHHSSRPSKLVLYEHEDRVAPGKTIVTSASPSGPATIGFGTINVVANVLRDGLAANSAVLGKAVGQVTFEDDLSLSLAFSFVVNTTSYAGSLTMQGTLDPAGNGELVVTGGTYDFRWAYGYAEVLTVSTEDQGDVVFQNTLYLKYHH